MRCKFSLVFNRRTLIRATYYRVHPSTNAQIHQQLNSHSQSFPLQLSINAYKHPHQYFSPLLPPFCDTLSLITLSLFRTAICTSNISSKKALGRVEVSELRDCSLSQNASGGPSNYPMGTNEFLVCWIWLCSRTKG
jgi:hypothetical protein